MTRAAGLIRCTAVRAACAAWTLACVAAAGAATVYVDGRSPSCSDAGPGTPVTPYCTISAALGAHAAAGNTIVVRPATYREQVTVPASGASGAPIVLLGTPGPGDPVIVSGASDLGQPQSWTQMQGDVWLAAAVNWSPVQVFRDTTRFMTFAGDPAQLPPGHFRYVSGEGLYVNAGGGNPGNDTLEVGRRAFGFVFNNRAHVIVEGFAVTRCEDRGIQIGSGSHDVEVRRNSITLCQRFGIQVTGATAVTVSRNVVSRCGDHGILVTGGSTGCLIERNESSGHAFAGSRRANGITLLNATGNVVSGNRTHHNQDTGLQLQPGADDNLLVQNLSWANEDHGIDVLRATGCTLIGNVVWGNFRDGFSIEGAATNTAVYNSIAVDNGLTTGRYDLFVDDSSSVGFVSNDNLFWNSTSQAPVRYRFAVYATVADFSAASGTDDRSLQQDPLFVAPAAGDFHLNAGSPAIDNANSGVAGWPLQDAGGVSRGDDPATPNTGLGPVPFADRGAHEYTAGGTVATGPPPRDGDAGAVVSPNPVLGEALLEFSLARAGPVRVGIYDLRGRRVKRLIELPEAHAGTHALRFESRRDDGRALEGGVYFYRIDAADGTRAGSFVVRR